MRLGTVDHHKVLLILGHGLILYVVSVLGMICEERDGLRPSEDGLVLSRAHVYKEKALRPEGLSQGLVRI